MTRHGAGVGRTAAVAVIAAASLVALTGGAGASTHRPAVTAKQLRAYMAQVEKVRLPVNDLLEGADPILTAASSKQISPAQAALEMNGLEEKFAGYLLAMQEIHPSNPTLARINAPYAHTYYLEDNYLATLASDLNDGSFDNLPNTQDAQRLAIIVWRTQMLLLAKKTHVALPTDIAQAGRGEIAPSPGGS